MDAKKHFVKNEGAALLLRANWNIANIRVYVRAIFSVGGQVFGKGSIVNIASPWMLEQISAHKAYRASVIDLNGDDFDYISDGSKWLGLGQSVDEQRAEEHIKTMGVQFQKSSRTIYDSNIDYYEYDKEVYYASSVQGSDYTLTAMLRFPIAEGAINKNRGEFEEYSHTLPTTTFPLHNKVAREAKEKLCRSLPPDIAEKAKLLPSYAY